MKTLDRLIFLIVVISLAIMQPHLLAQDPPAPTLDDTLGITPYGSYYGGDLDSVNLGNGNLTLHIPVVSYPQRGGQLGVSFSIKYNGKNVRVLQVCDPFNGCSTQWTSHTGAMQVTADQGVGVLDHPVKDAGGQIADYVSLQFPDGSTHTMGQTGGVFKQPQLQYTGLKNKQYQSTDGAGFRLSVDGSGNKTIISPSGVLTDPSFQGQTSRKRI